MDGPRTIEEVSGSSGPPDTGSYILRRLREGLVVWLGALCLGTFGAHAQDATWTPDSLANGATRDWNLSTNWTPAAVPTGIATFGGASTTAVSSIVTTSVDTLQFNFGAPAYSFDLTAATFSITGSGILNGSSNAPTFTTSAGGLLKFSSTNATSTAGNAVIVNNSSGDTLFNGNSTAGIANITNNGGVVIGPIHTGLTEFANTSTAGNSTITSNSTGIVAFIDTSSGGQARFITNAGGIFDISGLSSGGTTAGSIEGAGAYQLGSKTLTVGANDLSTEVSGIIVDAGFFPGTGGSLFKVGTGTLTLSGLNGYSGGTTISDGVLSVAADANLGNIIGGITLQGGELLTTNSNFATSRTIVLSGLGPNALAAATGTIATYNGGLTGTALQVGDLTGNGNNGTVILMGGVANTYTGGTSIVGGATLNVDTDAELGTGGPLTFDNGKLTTSGDTNGQFETVRPIVLNAGGGTLAAPDTSIDRTATFDGPISGSGGLTIGDANSQSYIVVLTNLSNSYTGGTTIVGGATLSVDTDSELGQTGITGGIALNGGTLETTSVDFTSGRAIVLMPTAGSDTLEVSFGSTATYNGPISGNGALTVFGFGGTIALTNINNSYSGGTVINFATLSVADDRALGSAGTTITLQGGELLTVTNGFTSPRPIDLAPGEDSNDVIAAVSGQTAFYTGVVFDAQLLQIGDGVNAGTVVLTNLNNSYSGGTLIVGNANGSSTLSVNADAELGDPIGGIELAGGTLLTTANFSTSRSIFLDVSGPPNTLLAADGTIATYKGIISGPGLLKLGASTLPTSATIVLTGNNGFSGGTDIFGLTVVAGGNNALGTGSVKMFGGVLDILSGVTLDNPISLFLGGTVNNAGILNNNITDAAGSPKVVINSGTINGNIQLAGRTNFVENLTGGAINGNVALAGANDTVQLFNGSKITGDVSLSGTGVSTLVLDGAGQQSLSAAVTGNITDNGLLVKQGTGTWTIDQDLTAPVETDVLAGTLVLSATLTTAQAKISPGGTLQLGNGGTTGSYSGPIVDNGSLVFNRTDAITFAGPLSGSGNVIQAGAGTTVLSGANTYSGGTVIELGTLLVDNPQALGTGNVAVNGGILAADPQPINVGGNYTQSAAGTLQLRIAGRAAGQFDTLNVGGNASLNGTLSLINLGFHPQAGDQLRLVTTGGVVTNRFATFQNPFTLAVGFNTVDLVYARQSVTLEFLNSLPPPVTPPPVTPAPGTPGEPTAPGEPTVPREPTVVMTTDFSSFAFTPNQSAAANLLDAVQLDPRATDLISFLNAEPFGNLPNDFQKISPEGLSAFYEISFSNANIQRLNLEGRLDDLHNGSNGFSSNMKVNGATVNVEPRTGADGKSPKSVVEPILQSGPQNRWGVWVTGFGDFVNVDGDGNAQGYNFTTGGVSVGIDYRITDQLAVGVMGDYSHTWTSLNPSGNIDVNSGRGGLYATWYNHGIYVDAAIYAGHNSYNSSRSGLDGLADGNTGGTEWSTFLSGGYDFHFGPLTVGPIAALQYTYANVNGFSENGSLAPMQIESNSVDSLRSDVGFRLFYQWQIGKVLVEPSLKAAWEHEYLYSALPITAGFAGIAGPSATFTGPSEGHDSAIVSAGVSAQWTPALTVYVNYDGQLGRGNYDSNAVTGGVRISF